MTVQIEIHKKLANFSLDVCFAAETGVTGLLGASGCGKSMTLKCIAGIETPDFGRIILNGRTLFDSKRKINLSPQQRRTGYLFQNYALFPHMTVEENIGAGIFFGGEEKRRLVREKLKAFYLEELAGFYPRQLSGGQKQRAALARMLAADPEIVMLDEPFSALDAHLRRQVERETMRQLGEYGKTILFVSHDRDEVYRLCGNAAVLSRGKLEFFGDKRELFASPRTLAASKLTGCKNHSRLRRLDGGRLYAEDWKLEIEVAGPVDAAAAYVGVRAHFIQPCRTHTEKNRFKPQALQVIEDTFQFIVAFKIAPDGCELVWDVAKEQWREIAGQTEGLELYIPEDKMIFLCK